eukprot:CAMPEP_0116848768 /NCGR_PEP_ID=MMETSP0418-20121206/15192_1 /TAXON_ID=1158023 /ORGANISM="Astrosyne radiata, Strain 13vi08-1A" /LENGTH=57 /DNA_ID=CAMNT_0004480399 /DNA_START=169 /DNA_END=342 /DNA_ORIENTATION=+
MGCCHSIDAVLNRYNYDPDEDLPGASANAEGKNPSDGNLEESAGSPPDTGLAPATAE